MGKEWACLFYWRSYIRTWLSIFKLCVASLAPRYEREYEREMEGGREGQRKEGKEEGRDGGRERRRGEGGQERRKRERDGRREKREMLSIFTFTF